MITNTRRNILEYIKTNQQVRVHELQQAFPVTKAALHRQLNKLLQQGEIVRIGKPPIVFYTLPSNSPQAFLPVNELSAEKRRIIEENFLSITPEGRLLYGLDGFSYWISQNRKSDFLEESVNEYVTIHVHQSQLFSSEGWIDATSKLSTTFKETPIKKLLLGGIYSYPTFGRTKLAKLIMFAKQTGEKKLIAEICEQVQPLLDKLIKKFAIQAIVFIPPTIPRPVQFMSELERNLSFRLPVIPLLKVVPGDVPVPQKILRTIDERVLNAKSSMYLRDNLGNTYKNILLIDDVTGSGASFHEVAKKLHSQNSTSTLIAFSLVGNIKGFEVIREI